MSTLAMASGGVESADDSSFDAIVIAVPVLPGFTSSIGCASSVSAYGRSKPAAASAAPGIGTAIPARVSIPKAGPTATHSRRNCSTSGTGRSISPVSLRPSAT